MELAEQLDMAMIPHVGKQVHVSTNWLTMTGGDDSLLCRRVFVSEKATLAEMQKVLVTTSH